MIKNSVCASPLEIPIILFCLAVSILFNEILYLYTSLRFSDFMIDCIQKKMPKINIFWLFLIREAIEKIFPKNLVRK